MPTTGPAGGRCSRYGRKDDLIASRQTSVDTSDDHLALELAEHAEHRPTGGRGSVDRLSMDIECPTLTYLLVISEETHMQKQGSIMLGSLLALGILIGAASAQQAPSPPPTTPYGAPIGLEAAKKLMTAAEAEAMKNNWGMAIAIIDSTGHVVMLHRMDNTQYGSIAVAEDKARTALDFRRPSKVFEDLVAQGGLGLRTLGLRGATPLEGGLPIIVDGKIIGAIGVSGATAVQDGQVAKAGADAAK
jgi:glc operon protein GlcG